MAVAESKDPMHILIADDHPVLREGLRKLLESQPDMIVVGESHDGADALIKVAQCNPDVLLLDLAMPRMNGFETLRALSKTSSAVKTILLAAAIEPVDALEALRCGARGIVLKESATQVLFKAIRAVIQGEYWLGSGGVSQLVDALRIAKEQVADQGRKNFQLTTRELDIVAAICAGANNKRIAAEFHISEQTVKNHLTAIFDKTGVANRLELALFAAKHNLVDKRL